MPGQELRGIKEGWLQRVQRYFQVAHAVLFRFGQLAGVDIDLDRRQYQGRHVQGGVAARAQGHELFFRDAVVQVDIAGALCGHGGFPARLAAGRRVVVAHEEAGCRRQRQQALGRAVEQGGRAAGKIAAGRTHVGHEQGVADKHGVADLVGQVGRRMARHVQRAHFQRADMEHLVGCEQLVELRAVGGGALLVINIGKRLLHRLDRRADGHFAAQLPLQIGRGRQVVGVGVGFQQPAARQLVFAHKGDHLVGRGGGRAARFRIVVEHRIDHGAGAAFALVHHIGDGGGGGVEEGLYVGRHHGGVVRAGMLIISLRSLEKCLESHFDM